MTIEEFINLGNKLSALHVDLTNNENANMCLSYRNEKDKGYFFDISLFFYNDNTTIVYKYRFYKADSLSEAKNKLEDLKKAIKMYA